MPHIWGSNINDNDWFSWIMNYFQELWKELKDFIDHFDEFLFLMVAFSFQDKHPYIAGESFLAKLQRTFISWRRIFIIGLTLMKCKTSACLCTITAQAGNIGLVFHSNCRAGWHFSQLSLLENILDYSITFPLFLRHVRRLNVKIKDWECVFYIIVVILWSQQSHQQS